MPFEIVRNDIVNMWVDAIVNTANPYPEIGSGTDAGIHAKAGPRLLEARKQIGRIPVGSAAITPGYDLPARYVIHTVGPVWQGGDGGEEELLNRCYRSSLELAAEQGCESVAFPLISAGNYGFPKERSMRIALSVFSDFLLTHEMQIYLVVFQNEAFRLSEKLFASVKSYVDEHYVRAKYQMEYPPQCAQREPRRRRLFEAVQMPWQLGSLPKENAPEPKESLPESVPEPYPEAAKAESEVYGSAMPAPGAALPDLSEMLAQTDAGFSETLLQLIDKSGKKDSEIYKRANVDRKLFSKIRNKPNYKPSKATALAFAIALELDLEETRRLIGRAGYALTRSSKFDIIVEFFILNRRYDIMEINMVLFEFDQALLGAS